MLQFKILFSLILASTILLGVSSSFLSTFQYWLVAYASDSNQSISSKTPPFSRSLQNSGIRTIISTPRKTTRQAISESAVSPKVLAAKNEGTHTKATVKRGQPLLQKAMLVKPVSRSASSATQHQLQPSLVIYPNEMVVEFPKSLATITNIKKAVSRLLVSDRPLQESELLSDRKIDTRRRPYFYRRVLDQNHSPIRYPKQAYRYADYLIDHGSEELHDEEGRFIAIHIPLIETGLKGAAKTYQAWVDSYANQFDVDPSLVYAVMETESGFNPQAVSRSNAIGLMQLKPDTAGKDVYQYIDFKPGKPSRKDLFDSKQNIRMGVAYLSLLKHDYLSEIMDDKIKKMVTISSYNGGIKTVLNLFGNTPKRAIDRLNRMSSSQVYRKLRYDHYSDETRRYLDKVLQAESKYQVLLGEEA